VAAKTVREAGVWKGEDYLEAESEEQAYDLSWRSRRALWKICLGIHHDYRSAGVSDEDPTLAVG